jgi:GTP-binding protein Era
MEKQAHKSGFVAILGVPNVGKSTLLNRMLGEKISITSKRPQTTRNRILGVLHRAGAQLIFIDTPGVHKTRNPLNARIVAAAWSALADADVILVMVDAAKPDPVSERLMLDGIRTVNKPVVLAFNKIDLIKKQDLLTLIDRWSKRYAFDAVVPVSATEGTQVEELVRTLERITPVGPPYFPAETLTDMPERFIAAEMIREKVFRLTGEEIPYSAAVTVESFKEEQEGKLIHIHAVIHMERDSQKAIVIGRDGKKLKEIGQAARREIERFFGTKVYLNLFVRVEKNWSRDTRALRKFGY